MVTIHFFQRNKSLRDGSFPIVLKLVKDRKPKIISIGMSCPKNEWDPKKCQFKKNHHNYVQRNAILAKIRSRSLSIIDDFRNRGIDFTLAQFEQAFRGESKSNRMTVYDFFQDKVEELSNAGRTGSSKAYKDTCDAFFKFYKDKSLRFQDLTSQVLSKWEADMRGRGNMDGGIAVRMRQMRALYNFAIEAKVANQKDYPFRSYKISRLKGRGVKRALTRLEIEKIYNLDLFDRPDLMDSRNYFLFSYFTRGMNFIDMMKLRWEDIQGDNIVYIRTKTKGRFSIRILDPVREILDHYRSLPSLTGYVFPIILKEGLTPKQIHYRKQKTLKKFNSDLKDIGELAKIDKPITSYVARHSFATNLKQMGVSTDVISESMGHQNINITNAYLKEFDDEVINKANELLKF